MVICFVGQPLCGKDTVAKYLEKQKGFNHISTGDIIREEMIKNNISIEPRENIRFFAEKSRRQHGNQYPVNIAVERIFDGINTTVSGPRNMTEINAFRSRFGKNFVLVVIDAPIRARYEWAKNDSRGRAGDNISFEQFKKEEDIERAGNSGSHELDNVIKAANYTILNNGSKEELFGKIDDLLKKIIK